MKGRLAILLLIVSGIYADVGVRGKEAEEAIDPLYYGKTDEPNFIIRWEYQDWCDHVYDPRVDIWRWPTDEEYGVMFNPAKVKPGDVIFVRMIPKFFEEMHPRIKHPYIIVTAGECLDKMKEWYKQYLDEEKVIAWFGIHPDKAAMKHPKFHAIPIGILQKPDHYYKRGRVNNYFKRLRTETKKKYLMYVNIAYEEKPERQMLRKKFLPESYVKRGKRQEFKDYLKESAESYFVLSPMGRAPDAYRTWEALFCGAIPVVRTSWLDPLYEGLPVLIIDDWDEVNEEFLKKKYVEMTSRKYDIAPLYWPFWADKVRKVQQKFREGLEA